MSSKYRAGQKFADDGNQASLTILSVARSVHGNTSKIRALLNDTNGQREIFSDTRRINQIITCRAMAPAN